MAFGPRVVRQRRTTLGSAAKRFQRSRFADRLACPANFRRRLRLQSGSGSRSRCYSVLGAHARSFWAATNPWFVGSSRQVSILFRVVAAPTVNASRLRRSPKLR